MPLSGHLGGLAVFNRDLVETRGIASGFIDLLLLVRFRFLQHLPRLAPGLGDQVVGIAFGIIHDAGRVGTSAGHITKGLGGFGGRN